MNTEETVGKKPQLHLFTDASRLGYGFCVYRRVVTNSMVILILLFAKSRVIPGKADESRHHNSIPRFELTGCRVVADFLEDFLRECGENYEEIYLWTDSQCSLKQIQDRQLRQETFVANRLSIIRAKTRISDWHYVDTKNNPADIVSRGLKADDDTNWDIFHHGPMFLRRPDWEAPTKTAIDAIGAIVEGEPEEEGLLAAPPIPAAKDLVASAAPSWILSVIDHQSIWQKKARLVARTRRCFRKWETKTHGERNDPLPSLTMKEIQKAETDILKEIQNKHFSVEIEILRTKSIFSPQEKVELTLKSSRLRKLNPFLGEDGIMRAGTRLIRAITLNYNYRCPIILPKKDDNVESLIRFYHKISGHSGTDYTRNALRQKYMILSDGQSVRTVVKKCVTCQRNFKAPGGQKMAPLPVDRLEIGAPFQVTGSDIFGPYDLKDGRKK